MLENNGYIKKNFKYFSEGDQFITYIVCSVYKKINANIILCKTIEDIYEGETNTKYSLLFTGVNENNHYNKTIDIDKELGKKLYNDEEFLVDFMNSVHNCKNFNEIDNYVNEQSKLAKEKVKVLK